jgi:hypothetical protein
VKVAARDDPTHNPFNEAHWVSCLRENLTSSSYGEGLETDQAMTKVPRQSLTRQTFYQDGKAHLGVDEYRMRSAEAIKKHWCLVFVAYSLLHLDCLPSLPMKGSLPIKTIGEACRQQAQALMQALILYTHEHLQLGQRVEDIFDYLFAKQQPVIAR